MNPRAGTGSGMDGQGEAHRQGGLQRFGNRRQGQDFQLQRPGHSMALKWNVRFYRFREITLYVPGQNTIVKSKLHLVRTAYYFSSCTTGAPFRPWGCHRELISLEAEDCRFATHLPN